MIYEFAPDKLQGLTHLSSDIGTSGLRSNASRSVSLENHGVAFAG